jgi:hypothetical protein
MTVSNWTCSVLIEHVRRVILSPTRISRQRVYQTHRLPYFFFCSTRLNMMNANICDIGVSPEEVKKET